MARLLDVPEVAARLRLHEDTVYTLIRTGRLGCARIGRRVLVPESVLDRYIAAITRDPSPQPVVTVVAERTPVAHGGSRQRVTRLLTLADVDDGSAATPIARTAGASVGPADSLPTSGGLRPTPKRTKAGTRS